MDVVVVVLFVVGVVASIMLHEWGHLVTARRFGMRAERFFLGFGPTLFSTRRGETEYGVKLLPLGGFVSIKGMTPLDERQSPLPPELADALRHGDDAAAAFRRLLAARGTPGELCDRLVDRLRRNLGATGESPSPPRAPLPVETPAQIAATAQRLIVSEVPDTGRVGDLHHRLLRGDDGRFFDDRPAWQRAVVLGAGSALHLLLAAALLFSGFLLFGDSSRVPVVDELAAGQDADGEPVPSAAEEAGLRPGDRILQIEGVGRDDFEAQQELVAASAGEPLELLIARDGQELTIEVTPREVTRADGTTAGVLGYVPQVRYGPLPADEALYQAVAGPVSVPAMLGDTFGALGSVFGPEGIGRLVGAISGEEERDPEGGISLVGAAQVAGQGTASAGPLFPFFLLAAVNVFVGLFNILPLPPLDGGKLAVLGVERAVTAVRRRRGETQEYTVDPRTVAALAVPVLLLVGVVSLGLVWLDVVNPIQL